MKLTFDQRSWCFQCLSPLSTCCTLSKHQTRSSGHYHWMSAAPIHLLHDHVATWKVGNNLREHVRSMTLCGRRIQSLLSDKLVTIYRVMNPQPMLTYSDKFEAKDKVHKSEGAMNLKHNSLLESTI